MYLTAPYSQGWGASHVCNIWPTPADQTHKLIPESKSRLKHWIGGSQWNDSRMQGKYGYIRFWNNHELTSTEVNTLYNNKTTTNPFNAPYYDSR